MQKKFKNNLIQYFQIYYRSVAFTDIYQVGAFLKGGDKRGREFLNVFFKFGVVDTPLKDQIIPSLSSSYFLLFKI